MRPSARIDGFKPVTAMRVKVLVQARGVTIVWQLKTAFLTSFFN
jgi:hypothetical protein